MLKFDKSKLVKNLATGNVLVPYLERVFDTFDEPWGFQYTEKHSDDAWHPSSDCVPNVSQLYAKTSNIAGASISGSLRKSFVVGHFWHQLIQHVILNKLEFCEPAAIERHAVDWWDEVEPVLVDPANPPPHGLVKINKEGSPNHGWGRPRPYHWVSGTGDIAPLVTPRWRGVVDIKTMSSDQFKRNTLPEWAAMKYECQINIYMSLFDEEQGLILAVNKDAPHDFKEFIFHRDQNLINAIYTKWHMVSEYLSTGTVPTDKDDQCYVLPRKVK